MTNPSRLKLSFSLYLPPGGDTASVGAYHPYFIVASSWLLGGSGIATLIPLSDDSPMPDRIHFVSEQGGPAAAIAAARDSVLGLPENHGLRSMPADLTHFQEW